MNKKVTLTIRILTLLSFILMLIINVLASVSSINGFTTGEISNSFESLFTPASFTFSIWGIIYISLSVYVIYQLLILKLNKNDQITINEINIYFILSSITNILWLLSWHYLFIFISVLLMILLFFLLMKIYILIHDNPKLKSNNYIKLPFSIYFGWITVANIANINVYLYTLNINNYKHLHLIWTIISLILGLILSINISNKNKDISYLFPILWGYTGILVRHNSESGFNNEYLSVIIISGICIIIIISNIIKIFINKE